jgi:hypothetical protein
LVANVISSGSDGAARFLKGFAKGVLIVVALFFVLVVIGHNMH